MGDGQTFGLADTVIFRSDPPHAAAMTDSTGPNEEDRVFESAAELFGVLATPIRLKIISAVCHGERNVSELLAQIETTQPNMSQHLSTLFRAGILSKRRDGTQIYYRLQSEKVAMLCRAVCTQLAVELDGEASVPAEERLLVAGMR
jgi:ArsR family transcriptional regulator